MATAGAVVHLSAFLRARRDARVQQAENAVHAGDALAADRLLGKAKADATSYARMAAVTARCSRCGERSAFRASSPDEIARDLSSVVGGAKRVKGDRDTVLRHIEKRLTLIRTRALGLCSECSEPELLAARATANDAYARAQAAGLRATKRP